MRMLVGVLLCSGAGYMAWSIHRSTSAAEREISAQVAEQARLQPAVNPLHAEETKLQALADRSPADAVRYGDWLIARHREPEARQFFEHLPAAIQSAAAVRDRRTELLAREGPSEALQQSLDRGDWGTVEPYPLQLALAAETAAETSHGDLAADLWQAARAAAAQQAATEAALRRLSGIWAGQRVNRIVR